MRIMHLSDCHIKKEYSENGNEQLFARHCSSTKMLVDVLEIANTLKVSLILITGDLVHDGNKEDYEHFLSIIKEMTPIKVIGVLGNHDDPLIASEVVGMKFFGLLDYCCEVDGYRFIGMNSAYDGQVEGKYTTDQLKWLKDVLTETSENGSFLMCHHPIVWNHPEFYNDQEKELLSIISNSDIKGIFCGHVHKNSVYSIDDGPIQISSESLLCGFEIGLSHLNYNQRTGYNIIDIDSNGIHVMSHTTGSSGEIFFRCALSH